MTAFSTTKELKATYNHETSSYSNIHVDLLVSKLSQMSYSKYFKMEILNTYELDNEHEKFEEKVEKVYTLIKIPLNLEKFFVYGFGLAFDSFMFMLALLPFRLFIIMKSVLCYILQVFFSKFSRRSAASLIKKRVLEPAQICDIVRGLLTLFCCFSLQYIDLSFLYHQVRGQNVLKVYIIFNMLDVADRLFSTLGQDLMDTVFWTATRWHSNKDSSSNNQCQSLSVSKISVPIQLLGQFFLAFAYIFLHSVIILLEATTLSVAFNSHNKSLLIVMMSNNFAELKGTVFKKFDKNNLYQLTCSDVRERLHLLILLSIVSVRNLKELNWDVMYFAELLPELLMVLLSEFAVDWVKHCFIAKFNEIPADVYSEYRLSLAIDMIMSKRKEAVSEHCDVVARKMGHSPIPLVCVLFKTFDQILFADPITTLLSVSIILPVCVAIKMLTSLFVLKQSCNIIKKYRHNQVGATTTVLSKATSCSNFEKPPTSQSSNPSPTHAPCSSLITNRSRSLQPTSMSETTYQFIGGEGDYISPSAVEETFDASLLYHQVSNKRSSSLDVDHQHSSSTTSPGPSNQLLQQTNLAGTASLSKMSSKMISTAMEPPLISASLEKLNQSEIGQGPLFTENSTVNLATYQLPLLESESPTSSSSTTGCSMSYRDVQRRELSCNDNTESPPEVPKSCQVFSEYTFGEGLVNKIRNIETLEASQSDDELVRSLKPVHAKAE